MGWEREKKITSWDQFFAGKVLTRVWFQRVPGRKARGRTSFLKGRRSRCVLGQCPACCQWQQWKSAGHPLNHGAHLPGAAVGLPGLVRAGELRLL